MRKQLEQAKVNGVVEAAPPPARLLTDAESSQMIRRLQLEQTLEQSDRKKAEAKSAELQRQMAQLQKQMAELQVQQQAEVTQLQEQQQAEVARLQTKLQVQRRQLEEAASSREALQAKIGDLQARTAATTRRMVVQSQEETGEGGDPEQGWHEGVLREEEEQAREQAQEALQEQAEEEALQEPAVCAGRSAPKGGRFAMAKLATFLGSGNQAYNSKGPMGPAKTTRASRAAAARKTPTEAEVAY